MGQGRQGIGRPRGVSTRHILFFLACALVLPGVAGAAPWPERPVRLIVGFPPGGAADILGRLAAQRRLLSDLREYQARTLAFLEGLRSGPPGAPGVDPMEPVDRLLKTGHSLLARLEQLPEPEEALET